MAIEWTPKLSVGVEKIDAQHRELFRKVNELLAAMGAHRGMATLEETLRFLRAYTAQHFAEEARMLRAARYPQLAEHLAMHDDFVRDFDVLAADLARNGATSHLTIRASNLLCDWLREHVSGADKAYGAFLAAAKAPAVPGY